jgi:transposase
MDATFQTTNHPNQNLDSSQDQLLSSVKDSLHPIVLDPLPDISLINNPSNPTNIFEAKSILPPSDIDPRNLLDWLLDIFNRLAFFDDSSEIIVTTEILRRWIDIVKENLRDKELLEKENEKLREEIENLKGQVASLSLKALAPKLTSRNGHLSPSTDITRPSSGTQGTDANETGQEGGPPQKRKQGAQPGHKRNQRKLFTLEEADTVNEYGREDLRCPNCGEELARSPEKDKQYDRYELVPSPIKKILTLIYAYKCPNCGKFHYGDVPENVVVTGLICNAILTLILTLKANSMSIRRIQEELSQFFNLDLSIGYINHSLKSMSSALRPIYLEILDNIKYESLLYIDETGHRNKGARVYTWVFGGRLIIAFKIATRSSFTLEVVLGDLFHGIISCDFYAAYRRFVKDNPNATLQFCMAHLIRDFKYCLDYKDRVIHDYGQRALDILRDIFKTYHELKEVIDKVSQKALELKSRLFELKDKLTTAALDAPSNCPKALAIAKRFLDFPEFYFTFMDNDAVEPTNNRAEVLIRSIVNDRKICQGTESQEGIWFSETIWSINATLKKMNIQAVDFFLKVLAAHDANAPLPSLVNYGSEVPQKYIDQARQEEEDLRAEKAKMAASHAAKTSEEAEVEQTTIGEAQDKDSPINAPSRPKTKLTIVIKEPKKGPEQKPGAKQSASGAASAPHKKRPQRVTITLKPLTSKPAPTSHHRERKAPGPLLMGSGACP